MKCIQIYITDVYYYKCVSYKFTIAKFYGICASSMPTGDNFIKRFSFFHKDTPAS